MTNAEALEIVLDLASCYIHDQPMSFQNSPEGEKGERAIAIVENAIKNGKVKE
jgi:hypothetical protein